MPLSAETWRKNSSKASRPPADAPIPTTGKASAPGLAGGAGAAGGGTGGMATGARGAIFPAPFGAFLGEDFEDLEPFLARRRPGGTRIGGWCHLGPANSTTRGRRNVETLPGTA